MGRQHSSCQASRPSTPTRDLVGLVPDSADETVEELKRAQHHDRQESRGHIPLHRLRRVVKTLQVRLQTIHLATEDNFADVIQLLNDMLEVCPALLLILLSVSLLSCLHPSFVRCFATPCSKLIKSAKSSCPSTPRFRCAWTYLVTPQYQSCCRIICFEDSPPSFRRDREADASYPGC